MSKMHKGHYKPVAFKKVGEEMVLDLPEIEEEDLVKILPTVSIVTITYNRGEFASLMMYNWGQIKYPRNKLEWIIVDDSDADYPYQLADYLPQDDPTIKYIRLKKWIPIDQKRNISVENASNDIIVHMDDDDWYFSDHVLAKVRVMLHYKCQGVISQPFGTYDLETRKSVIVDGKIECNYILEASLAYWRSYWETHKFASAEAKGNNEGAMFIGRNMRKFCNIHFLFNMISITHGKNFTGGNRKFHDEIKEAGFDNANVGSFFDMFTPEFQAILVNLQKLKN